MPTLLNALKTFFAVVIRPQTYLNLIYLLLAFPLGLFYFVFLITGISLGLTTIIIWIGLAILALTMIIWYALGAFERYQAIGLLRVAVPPIQPSVPAEPGFWNQLKTFLKNPFTWKSLLFLLIKFPLGTIAFCLLVTLGSLSLALLVAPFYYPYDYIHISFDSGTVWAIDTLAEAVLLSLVGVLMTLTSLHAFNALAWVFAQLSRSLLGNALPAAPAAPLTPLSPDQPETPPAPAAPESPVAAASV